MADFDVGIIGGGVAGSALAILLAREGRQVAVFEQNDYPKHKVCGEFISNESRDFFLELGVEISQDIPEIDELQLTTPSGYSLHTQLRTGGFGMSRFNLDQQLYRCMLSHGVKVFHRTKVTGLAKGVIHVSQHQHSCRLIIGSFGKYAPSFVHTKTRSQAKAFVGVKYHIIPDGDLELPDNRISLHAFDGGYCGISMVEDGKYCLCYLVKSDQLKRCNSNLDALESRVLCRNPNLEKIFSRSRRIFSKPLVISNISLDKKGTFHTKLGIIMTGDAAGAISPLAGNGISMAARSAFALHNIILQHGLEFEKIYRIFDQYWNEKMGNRVRLAKYLNAIMLKPGYNEFVIRLMAYSPLITGKVVGSMQGPNILEQYDRQDLKRIQTK